MYQQWFQGDGWQSQKYPLRRWPGQLPENKALVHSSKRVPLHHNRQLFIRWRASPGTNKTGRLAGHYWATDRCKETKINLLRCGRPAAGPRLAAMLSLQEPEGISGVAGHFPQARRLCWDMCCALHSLCIPGASPSLRQLVTDLAGLSLSLIDCLEVRVWALSSLSLVAPSRWKQLSVDVLNPRHMLWNWFHSNQFLPLPWMFFPSWHQSEHFKLRLHHVILLLKKKKKNQCLGPMTWWIYILGWPKCSSGFFLKILQKSKWTVWPTQYLGGPQRGGLAPSSCILAWWGLGVKVIPRWT